MANPEITQTSFAPGSAAGQRLVQGPSERNPGSEPRRPGKPPTPHGAKDLPEPARAGEEFHSLCRLTTFAWTGAGIETRTRFASTGNKVLLRLAASSAEIQRIWNRTSVRLVPCTPQGRPSGPTIEGDARVLSPDEEDLARQAMGVASGPSDRFLRGDEVVYVEVLPIKQLANVHARLGHGRAGDDKAEPRDLPLAPLSGETLGHGG